MEKSDEFDEWILNRQNFALKNLRLTIYNYLYIRLWSLSRMSGHGILKYFRPILDKKVPPEDKELYSIRLGHYRRFAREGYG